MCGREYILLGYDTVSQGEWFPIFLMYYYSSFIFNGLRCQDERTAVLQGVANCSPMIKCHQRRNDSLIGGLLEMTSKNQFVSSQEFLKYKPSKADSTYYIYLHSLCTFSHENSCLEVMVWKMMAAEIVCVQLQLSYFPLFDVLSNCCLCCEFKVLCKGYLLFDCTEYSKAGNMRSSSDNNRLFL